jgi:signal transduction histidine kinase
MIRERLAQETFRADAEAERRRQLLQLVAGVAHEVNTPLGIINTAASVIVRDLASDAMQAVAHDPKTQAEFEDLQEAANLIQKHIIRAHKLIQSFKNVSVDQITDTKEAINLSETVAEIVNLFRASARKAKLELIVTDTLSPKTREWIGYRGHLSQILLNLFTNIESYAYPNGAGGRVQISVAANHQQPTPDFSITVKDFGQGIAAENLPHICEPFFTTGRAKGGTGLGLAIVHNLVTQVFKGSLLIESQPGEGTTVLITFPQTIVT